MITLAEVANQETLFWATLKAWVKDNNLDWNLQSLTELPESNDFSVMPAMIHLAPEASELLLPRFVQRTPEVNSVKCFDLLSYEYGNFWPRLIWTESLKKTIVHLDPQLDIRAWAFIAGEGAQLRMATSVVHQLGYSKIKIVSEEPEAAEEQAIQLRKILSGVDLEVLVKGSLTLQPVIGTIFINVLNLEQYKELAQDIAYFNFLRADGLVIEAYTEKNNSNLCLDAEGAGFKTFGPFEILQGQIFEFISLLKKYHQIQLKGEFSLNQFLSQKKQKS